MKWSNLTPLRVALLDDHAIIRNGFAIRLLEEPDIELAGVYESSREMLVCLRSVPLDILVLDYSLQQHDLDGLNLIRLLRIRFPNIRILIFSANESSATISLSLRAGARGFVGKTQEVDELISALRTVASEKIYLSDSVAHELGYVLDSSHKVPDDAQILSVQQSEAGTLKRNVLSPREQEVLRCSLSGMLVSQIATKFNRSRKTISGQKQAAFRKLGVRSDIELYKIRGELGID